MFGSWGVEGEGIDYLIPEGVEQMIQHLTKFSQILVQIKQKPQITIISPVQPPSDQSNHSQNAKSQSMAIGPVQCERTPTRQTVTILALLTFFCFPLGAWVFYVPLSFAINLVIFLSKLLFNFSGLHSLSVENSPLRLTVTITQCCWFSLRFHQNLRLRLTTWGGHRLSRQPADNR